MLESDLKLSKSHANVVSFEENVSYLLTSMNLYSAKGTIFFFFMNETAIELTAQTVAPLYNILIYFLR